MRRRMMGDNTTPHHPLENIYFPLYSCIRSQSENVEEGNYKMIVLFIALNKKSHCTFQFFFSLHSSYTIFFSFTLVRVYYCSVVYT